MAHIVKVIFKGENLSCGFIKNQEYTLSVGQSDNGKHICVSIAKGFGTETEISCSMWDNVRKI